MRILWIALLLLLPDARVPPADMILAWQAQCAQADRAAVLELMPTRVQWRGVDVPGLFARCAVPAAPPPEERPPDKPNL